MKKLMLLAFIIYSFILPSSQKLQLAEPYNESLQQFNTEKEKIQNLIAEKFLSIQFNFIAGESPKVFTDGWVFGAKCNMFPGLDLENDISEKIHWKGTAKFYPEYGSVTHPVFNNPGFNEVTAECEVNGIKLYRTFNVFAVSPDLYAAEGDYVICPACSHGCPACPHSTTGTIQTGSSTVKVRNKPAARVGDIGITSGCCGSGNFTILEGDNDLLIDGKPAARIGSKTQHCGGFGLISGMNPNTEKIDIKDPLGLSKYVLYAEKKSEKEKSLNVFYPGERIPAIDLINLLSPPEEFMAEDFIKSYGADYSNTKSKIIDKFYESSGIPLYYIETDENLTNLNCVKELNEAFKKLGVLYAAKHAINDMYTGKKSDEIISGFKNGAFDGLNLSTGKIGASADFIIQYVLNSLGSGVLDIQYDTWKKAFFKFYSDDSKVKRNQKQWYQKIKELNEVSLNGGDDLTSRIETELYDYLSLFWNPDNYAFYMPPGGFTGELSHEEKQNIQNAYKTEVLFPVINAVLTGITEQEKLKVTRETYKQIESIEKNMGAKFPIIMKVKGPKEKISKIKVALGEWSGYTNKDGEFKFDATLYAILKNNNPKAGTFFIEDQEQYVPFTLLEGRTTEIIYELPAPVELTIDVQLRKEAEQTGFTAFAGCSNLSDKITAVEYRWYVNDHLYTTDYKSKSSADVITSSTFTNEINNTGNFEFKVVLVNSTPEIDIPYEKVLSSAKKNIKIDAPKKKDITVKKETPPEKKKDSDQPVSSPFPPGEHYITISLIHLDNCSDYGYQATMSIPKWNAAIAYVSEGGAITVSYNYTNPKNPVETESLTGSGSISKSGDKFKPSLNLKYTYKIDDNIYGDAVLNCAGEEFGTLSGMDFWVTGTYNYVNMWNKVKCSSTISKHLMHIQYALKK